MKTPVHLCKCDECPLKGSTIVPGDYSEGKYFEEKIDVPDPENPKKILGWRKIQRWIPEEVDTVEVVFVAMAPAREEIEQGRPLVGWSGKLFRSAASQVGYDKFWMTNTLLCQIPEEFSTKDQNQAIRCCSERLFEEIRQLKPKLVAVMGNMPLRLLTGIDYNITAVAGRILPGLVCDVLPIVHPAALKRRPEEFPDFVDELQQGIKWLDGSYQTAFIPETVVVDEDNIAQVCQILDNVNKEGGLVAIDLETTKTGFYPYGRNPDLIRCMALAVDPRTAYIVPGFPSPHFEDHPNLVLDPRWKEVLGRSKLVTHNGTFDIGFLYAAGLDNLNIYFDTFLAHYMLDEREYSHGLKPLSHKYLGAPDWEDDIKSFLPNKNSSYDLIPDDKLYTYASSDVAYTLQLAVGARFIEQMPKVYWDLLIPCANMFTKIRNRGIDVDIEVLMEMDDLMDQEIEALTTQINESIEGMINPFSPKEVAELMYDVLKLPMLPHKGRSTDKRVLEYYRGVKEIDLLREVRQLGKLRGTYVSGLANFVDRNYKVHPLTKLHGTVTGRISTEDPSVMNITRKGGIKRIFIPSKDHLILDGDNKGMELRCYALLADDKFLKDLLQASITDKNKDPHFVAGKLATEKCGREIDRTTAKAGVFGAIYGRGVESFKSGLRMSDADAKTLRSTILSMFPTISDYNKSIKKMIHSQGYIESFFGRRRRFGLITDENRSELYRQGVNFPVQSMASDINLYGMLHLWGMKEKLGMFPLFPVHDSILFDVCSEDCIPEIKREWERYSKELVGSDIDFWVEFAAGKSWGDVEKVIV